MYKAKIVIDTIDTPRHRSERFGPFHPDKGWKSYQKPRTERTECGDGLFITHTIGETGTSHTYFEQHCATVYGTVTKSEKDNEVGTEVRLTLQAKELHPEWNQIRKKQREQFSEELSDLVGNEVEIERDFIMDLFNYEKLK